MVSPVNNGPAQPATSALRQDRAGEARDERRAGDAAAEERSEVRTDSDDSVTLSAAARREAAPPPSRELQSDEAAGFAADLARQISGNGAQAMAAQAGRLAPELGELL